MLTEGRRSACTGPIEDVPDFLEQKCRLMVEHVISADPLNLVHVVRQYRPGIGGIETLVEQLARAQVRDRHRVRVITLDRIFDDGGRKPLAARETLDGVEVERIPFRGSKRYPLAPGVLDRIADADLVHVHAVDFFADFLALTSPYHRRPMVLSTHGGFFHTEFAARLKKVYFNTVTRASLSRYAAVIAGGAEDERLFRPIAGDRLSLIPNKVDLEKFAGLADRAGSDILYFGRIAPNKQPGRLIRWFAPLAARDPGPRLILAGKPMGETIERLAGLAAELGVADRVDFHAQPSDDQLKQLIARSAIYACASSYEGFGLAAIEGVSAGLYPLLSPIPPFAAHVGEIGFGTLVDFDDPASWEASYDRLATGFGAFRADIGAHEIRRRLRPFDLATMAADHERIYRQVLDRRTVR